MDTSPNLYAVIAEQIRAKVLSTPPSGYKARLIIQLVLCTTKLGLAIAYMVLTYLDLRKRGKSLRLLRVQRLQHGKILVCNPLFLYVLISAAGAIYLAFVRYKSWTVYYGSGTPKNTTILVVMQFVPIFLAAFTFTSGNMAALLMMSRRARGFESASRISILIMNAGLVAVMVLFFATMLPVALVANVHVSEVFGDGLLLMNRLDAVSKAFAAGLSADPMLDGLSLTDILAEVQDLESRETQLRPYIYALLAIAIFFCAVFAIAALASLRFVLMLRKESKRTMNIGIPGKLGDQALRSIAVTREETVMVEEADSFLDFENKLANPSSMPPSYALKTVLKSPGGGGANRTRPFADALESSAYATTTPPANVEAVALQRLVNDLLLAVPCVLASCFVLPICTFWGWISRDPSWINKELQLDGFSWPELITSNIILLFFTVNLVLNPARYQGQASEELKTIGGRTAPPGFEFRLQSAGDAIQTVDRVYVTSASSDDGEISLASTQAGEQEKEW